MQQFFSIDQTNKMTGCMALWPASECGLHGICETANENNTTIGSPFCVCDEEWTHSEEFDYFSGGSSFTGVCGYNKSHVRVLYTVCAAVTGISLILQLVVIRKKSQLKRLWAAILSLLFPFSASMVRLNNQSSALFGKNLFFMFLVAHGNAFILVAISIFLMRTNAMKEQRQVITELVTQHIPRARAFRRVSFFFGFMGVNYFGIPLLLDYGINVIWTYFIPVSYCLWSFVVLSAIYTAAMKKLSTKRLKNDPKSAKKKGKVTYIVSSPDPDMPNSSFTALSAVVNTSIFTASNMSKPNQKKSKNSLEFGSVNQEPKRTALNMSKHDRKTNEKTFGLVTMNQGRRRSDDEDSEESFV
mmetsp:Transcript_21608/g.26159  ORF Transcript_21608/g.26159 Transcript_21608/m.26159 type:complete len:357 (+) Transcript_21608:56-1126(+)